MEKTVIIGGKEVLMRATAATPLHYRNQFPGHDLFKELQANEGKALDELDYSVFERMAYIMSGAFKEGTSLEDWLEQFDGIMDVMEAVAEIMDTWNDNAQTQNTPHPNEETAESTTPV